MRIVIPFKGNVDLVWCLLLKWKPHLMRLQKFIPSVAASQRVLMSSKASLYGHRQTLSIKITLSAQ